MHRSARSLSSVPSRASASVGVRVRDLADLRAGDVVEIRRWDTVHHRGVVDVACPRLGVLWIVDGPLRDRTLVHAAECSIWRVRQRACAS
ncbi:hypothetical protein E7Z53_16360 [Kocuria salina]|uniref:hypothetical protein n=1 Tax=Kocuria salina TaxID=1929416 RepID=UPI0015937B0F|nr:hypothetical protein [Kocuria salina]NVC25001.1 hypothetical protein [Kocuria salina]